MVDNSYLEKNVILIAITSNDRNFSWPTIYINTLTYIHNSHNNAWDNRAHSLTAKAHFAIITYKEL